MADWNLKLTEDALSRRHPIFPTLAERIAAYEDFYFPSVSRKALSREETAKLPGKRRSGHPPDTVAFLHPVVLL